MSGNELNLLVALKQIDKLQSELIKTEQVVKDALLDNIAQNVGALLEAIINPLIPNLLSKIDALLKKSGFEIESSSIDIIEDKRDELNEMEVDIKEEIIVGEELDYDNDDTFEEFAILPDSGPDEESISSGEQNKNKRKLIPPSEISSPTNWNNEGAFIISGESAQEKEHSLAIFINRCFSISGVKEKLDKFKTYRPTVYHCPICEKAPSKDRWKLMRHLIRVHSESDLIPLPFMFHAQAFEEEGAFNCPNCSNSYSTKKNLNWHLSKRHKIINPEEESEYVIEDESSLHEFSKLCLRVPGAKKKMMEFRLPDGSFKCSVCSPAKILTSSRFSDFMTHLVRHGNSELIPLPFSRQTKRESTTPTTNTKRRRKMGKGGKSRQPHKKTSISKKILRDPLAEEDEDN